MAVAAAGDFLLGDCVLDVLAERRRDSPFWGLPPFSFPVADVDHALGRDADCLAPAAVAGALVVTGFVALGAGSMWRAGTSVTTGGWDTGVGRATAGCTGG